MHLYLFYIDTRLKDGPKDLSSTEDADYELYAYTNQKLLKDLFLTHRKKDAFVYRKLHIPKKEYNDMKMEEPDKELQLYEFITKYKKKIFYKQQCCTYTEANYIYDEDYSIGFDIIMSKLDVEYLANIEKTIKKKYKKYIFRDYGGLGIFIHYPMYPTDEDIVEINNNILYDQGELFKGIYGYLYEDMGVDYESMDILCKTGGE